MDIKALFSLEGRTALVTGGSRGIGKMIAEGYVRSGVRTYISSRKAEVCDQTAEELSQWGECISLPADLSTAEGVTSLVSAFREREEKLDILVNNAGAAWGAPFEEFPEGGWDKVMNINLKSPFFLTQALHKDLKAACGDHPAKVINIASIDGISLNPLETYSYHASKAGLIHLTKKLAVRLAEDGIVMTAIAPGAFASEMNFEARDHADEIKGKIPAARIGRDEDIAGAAIYLASAAGDYVLGSTLIVDGGVAYAR